MLIKKSLTTVALLASLLGPCAAFAHAHLKSATPAADSTVTAPQDLRLTFNVPNRLQEEDADSELPVELDIRSMSDFNPASVVEQVPELRQLMELREALVAGRLEAGDELKLRHEQTSTNYCDAAQRRAS